MRRALTGEAGDHALGLLLGREAPINSSDTRGRLLDTINKSVRRSVRKNASRFVSFYSNHSDV